MDSKLKLIEIFKNTFQELEAKSDSEISSITKGDLISWDSGSHLILMTCIEEDFEIQIEDESIVQINSFNDAYRVVEATL